jgi:hypothetical protein
MVVCARANTNLCAAGCSAGNGEPGTWLGAPVAPLTENTDTPPKTPRATASSPNRTEHHRPARSGREWRARHLPETKRRLRPRAPRNHHQPEQQTRPTHTTLSLRPTPRLQLPTPYQAQPTLHPRLCSDQARRVRAPGDLRLAAPATASVRWAGSGPGAPVATRPAWPAHADTRPLTSANLAPSRPGGAWRGHGASSYRGAATGGPEPKHVAGHVTHGPVSGKKLAISTTILAAALFHGKEGVVGSSPTEGSDGARPWSARERRARFPPAEETACWGADMRSRVQTGISTRAGASRDLHSF